MIIAQGGTLGQHPDQIVAPRRAAAKPPIGPEPPPCNCPSHGPPSHCGASQSMYNACGQEPDEQKAVSYAHRFWQYLRSVSHDCRICSARIDFWRGAWRGWARRPPLKSSARRRRWSARAGTSFIWRSASPISTPRHTLWKRPWTRCAADGRTTAPRPACPNCARPSPATSAARAASQVSPRKWWWCRAASPSSSSPCWRSSTRATRSSIPTPAFPSTNR